MKNACLLGTLALCCQLFFVGTLNAQKYTPGDPPPQKKHVLLVDDPDIDCSNAIDHISTISVKLLALNLPESAICDAPRLQIREESTNTPIGLTAPIELSATDWTVLTDTEEFTCHDDPSYTYYQRFVLVDIDLTPFICYDDEVGLTNTIGVVFEYVESTPNSLGTYDPYYNQNWLCMNTYFPPQCLDHEHEGDASPDGTVVQEPVLSITDGPEDFIGEGSYCYKCVARGFGNPVKGLSVSTQNQNNTSNNQAFGDTPNLSAYPSPFTTQVFLDYNAPMEQEIQLEIRNLNGAIILANNQIVNAGNNSFEFDLSNQTAGIYFIRLWNGQEWISQKIVKGN